MNKPIVKRMEDLLYTPEHEKQPIARQSMAVTTCTRQRRLRGLLKTELLLKDNIVAYENVADYENLANSNEEPKGLTSDNDGFKSKKDLIAARIAQTEGPDVEVSHTPINDGNRTIVNLDSLAASIYFWSPNAGKQYRKPRFIQDKLRGPKCSTTFNNGPDNSVVHRNKDAFINFSQPALIVVAENPETPVNTLKWLSAHHSAAVRKAVAKNQNTDEETLRLLADDFDTSVQSAVLENTNISKELTVKLAASSNFSIAAKARNVYYQLTMQSKRPQLSVNEPGDANELIKNELEFLKIIADSADTSRRLVVKSPHLVADWHIRMLVAGDPNATAEILWQLASHPISQVKRKLVDKYNCLLETMVNLKGSRNSKVETLAASSTDTIS